MAFDGSLKFDTAVDSKGFHSGIEKIGSLAADGCKAVAGAFAAAYAAAGAAVAGLTKTAVENYADYEQLVGGVETLFKDSADTVMDYANAAFETAGLSANAYMETVTSFSASLLQSLGGDTVEAADKANMAIVDMSDNANKMGTDMASIQNAYQGFAKQNYTMLDNLKLGYGIATRCDFTDCNFMLDMPFTVESGRRVNLFSYSGLEDCLMRGSITLSGTGNGGLLYITDGNKPMKNSFIAVEFTNTSEYTIGLYPVKATATSCIVKDLIGSGITYYNGDNIQYVTAAQGKDAAYLNSVGFPVTEV